LSSSVAGPGPRTCFRAYGCLVPHLTRLALPQRVDPVRRLNLYASGLAGRD